MAREDLIPLNKRTKDEQKKIASMGGKASGKARRKRKTLKENMNALLELVPSNARDYNKLVKAGIELEDIDNSQLITLALFNEAKNGNIQAIKELRDLIGEDKADVRSEEADELSQALEKLAEDIINDK